MLVAMVRRVRPRSSDIQRRGLEERPPGRALDTGRHGQGSCIRSVDEARSPAHTILHRQRGGASAPDQGENLLGVLGTALRAGRAGSPGGASLTFRARAQRVKRSAEGDGREASETTVSQRRATPLDQHTRVPKRPGLRRNGIADDQHRRAQLQSERCPPCGGNSSGRRKVKNAEHS